MDNSLILDDFLFDYENAFDFFSSPIFSKSICKYVYSSSSSSTHNIELKEKDTDGQEEEVVTIIVAEGE